MTTHHILLPRFAAIKSNLLPAHEEWISQWLKRQQKARDKNITSAASCVAGFIGELALYGCARTDWPEVMADLLTVGSLPTSYSERFAQQLYKFENQSIQHTVHAIYSRWFIESSSNKNADEYVEHALKFSQDQGWFYNPEVSCTQERTRMRAELFMSAAFAAQMTNAISQPLAAKIDAFPDPLFVSTEYFRSQLKSLAGFDPRKLEVVDLLRSTKLPGGFSDFLSKDKVDDYMGVKKRSDRDTEITSPIVSLYALELAKTNRCEEVNLWHDDIRGHLNNTPTEFPYFQMRDLSPPFGSGTTIYEILAAAILVAEA